MPTDLLDTAARGQTPRELARVLRVSPDRIRSWIVSGELGAIDVATVRCRRPRYIVLPHHLAEFECRRAAATPPKPQRRRRAVGIVDYYGDDAGSGGAA